MARFGRVGSGCLFRVACIKISLLEHINAENAYLVCKMLKGGKTLIFPISSHITPSFVLEFIVSFLSDRDHFQIYK